MRFSKKSSILLSALISMLFFATPVSAAAPDGVGPWADNVISFSQGLMKNGNPVPAARSHTTAAVGVAEDNTVEGNFLSLGFGGKIVLGFINGISSGVIVVEATNPDYPIEKASVEVSENGTTWTLAGMVSQDGSVTKPAGINCAKYVRITDISDPAIMSDPLSDGYDVDGVRANGDRCRPPHTPTPTRTPTPTPTPKPPHFDFPSCNAKLPKPGDKSHYVNGKHQIVGGPLLSGSDDVYSLKKNNYLQCFCPEVGNQGIQTNWLRTDQAIPGWFFANGNQWNLGNVTYAAQNKSFTCQTKHHFPSKKPRR